MGFSTAIYSLTPKKSGEKAFLNCSKLKSITIGEDVQTIATHAFEGNGKAESVIILEGCKKIGESAFQECPSVKTVRIPASTEEISEGGIFYSPNAEQCLAEITVAEGNSVYYSSGNCIMQKADKRLILGCATSVIPEETLAIGNYAFQCCGIEELVLPVGVESVGIYAFLLCQKLERVEIPGTVKTIGGGAFELCVGLKELILHEGIEELQDYCFSHTVNLRSVIIPESASVDFHINDVFYCGAAYSSGGSSQDAGIIPLADLRVYSAVKTALSKVVNSTIDYDGDYAYVSSITYDSSTAMKYYSSMSRYLNVPPARKGYEFLGFSLNEKSLTADYPVVVKEPVDRQYKAVIFSTIKPIGGLYKSPIVEFPDSLEDGTVLYAVWEKVE